MKIGQRWLSLFLAVLLVMSMSVLTACSASDKEAADNPDIECETTETSQTAELVVPEELVGTTINILSAYGGQEEIFSTFTEDTGIKVEYLDMSSGEVLARLRAEEGDSVGEVWFGGGVDSFIAAKEDGLIEPYVSPFSDAVPAEFKDAEGYWTGVSLVTVCFVVNEEVAQEKGLDIPQTWEDITAPAYKDEIAMSNPAISGTAYTILTGILQSMGEDAGWEFFAKIDDNIPFYSERGGEPPQKAALGEAIVGLAPGTGEDLKAEGYPVVAVFPKDGTPWWPSPVSILSNAENLGGAKVFVDWCLSPHGQEVLRDNDPRLPVRSDVEPPQALIDAGIMEADLQTIDFELMGQVRDDVVAKWEADFGSKK